MRRKWQGSVYRRKQKLWLKIKTPDGEWVPRKTPFHVGEEAQAKKLLAKVRNQLHAGEDHGAVLGQLTVAQYAKKFLAERRALAVADADNDDGRLKNHILPVIGTMPLAEVRPRHVRDLVTRARVAGLASRTVRNIYSVCRSLFREAAISDLIETTPCILKVQHLGSVEDKNPDWRHTAVYSRAELEQLISDPRIPRDRRVVNALLGIGALRLGEAAGLRWRMVDFDMEPLGRLVVVRSYAKERTKTKVQRWMPIHPTLRVILKEWRLTGWSEAFGREPKPDDLVVPTTKAPAGKGRRLPPGVMRNKKYFRTWSMKDEAVTGIPHRRLHDLRRTTISLARADGADKDVLKRGTHSPPKDVMELYTSVDWERLCAEVKKLRVRRSTTGDLVHLVHRRRNQP